MARQKFDKVAMLEAAKTILRDKGAGNLTIQAVAERVGCTKGAVLHWYPSKKALVDAVVSHMVQEWDETYEANLSNENSVESFLSAYLDTWQSHDGDASSYAEAMILLLAEAPDRLEQVREAYSKYSRPVTEAADDDLTPLLLWLACEGLEMLTILGLLRIPATLREEVYRELRARNSQNQWIVDKRTSDKAPQ